MRFLETPLPGCFVIETTPHCDERGAFARTFCVTEFAAHGLHPAFVQTSASFSRGRGTLRGLHFQAAPAMEEKLVRCHQGAIFDVAVDLRRDSPTFGRWHGVELSDANDRQLYIPKGFAHGFQTLTDIVHMTYQIGPAFQRELSAGVRWDDPDIGVAWPLSPGHQSERDLQLPTLAELDPAATLIGASVR